MQRLKCVKRDELYRIRVRTATGFSAILILASPCAASAALLLGAELGGGNTAPGGRMARRRGRGQTGLYIPGGVRKRNRRGLWRLRFAWLSGKATGSATAGQPRLAHHERPKPIHSVRPRAERAARAAGDVRPGARPRVLRPRTRASTRTPFGLAPPAAPFPSPPSSIAAAASSRGSPRRFAGGLEAGKRRPSLTPPGRPARARAEDAQSPRARGGARRFRWMGSPDAGGEAANAGRRGRRSGHPRWEGRCASASPLPRELWRLRLSGFQGKAKTSAGPMPTSPSTKDSRKSPQFMQARP